MSLREEWICRGEVKIKMSLSKLADKPSCESLFTQTFWPEVTLSGLRAKPLPNPPLLMRQLGMGPFSFKQGRMLDQVGTWDLVGEWDSCKISLRLLPRSGVSPMLLRGYWGVGLALVSSVHVELTGGMWKQGLELVRRELLREEQGQMYEGRQSFKRLHSNFASNKLEGFDDLIVAAADGREVRSS